MFERRNWDALEEAVTILTSKEPTSMHEVKYGLKICYITFSKRQTFS